MDVILYNKVSKIKEEMDLVSDEILDIQDDDPVPFFTGDQSDDYLFAVNDVTLKVVSSETLYNVVANVENRGTLTIKKSASSRFMVSTYSSSPEVGSTALRFVDVGSAQTSYELQLQQNENYVAIAYYRTTSDGSLDRTTIKNSVNITSSIIGKHSEVVKELENGIDVIDGVIDLQEKYVPFFTGGMAEDTRFTIDGDTLKITESSVVWTVVANVSGHKKIKITKDISTRCILATCANIPAVNGYALRYIDAGNTTTNYDLTLNDGENYLIIIYYRNNDTSHVRTVIKRSITISDQAKEKYSRSIDGLKNAPVSIWPDYVVKSLAYRPVGPLSKGYILMTFDDGASELATYTIPTLIAKEVPGTFGLFSDCACMTNSTYRDVLLDAVNDHGCCIAQHGARSWSRYTESELVEFYKKESDAFADYSLTVHGAICPGESGYEDTSETIKAIAGGMFGAVFSGGTHGELQYGSFANAGARTSLYAMTRESGIRLDATEYQTAIDYAYDNHTIFCPFWHDEAFTNDATNKTIFEGLIDYAKTKGLTFITMADLKNII